MSDDAALSTWIDVPRIDAKEPELSIVIPALNEELTITEFVQWCHEGMSTAGVIGEIVIVDSSTDRTAELALAAGARVLHTPRRGLGRAYIEALPFIRGKWILMGDADCTYDFRRLEPFIEQFSGGSEYVMGSRWKGSIEKGAMPPHHQYFGTPLTTWILNRIYSSSFTDIHCGMRGITRDALERMQLQSQSWEYASEMVLKSVHMNLRTSEVPVHFLKDRDGRLSHHKREGWFSPFKAAWINLRAMFIYGADFFTLVPGLIMLALGLAITIPTTFGPMTIGPISLSLHWQLFGVIMTTVGLVGFLSAVISKVLFDYTGSQRRRWLSILRYTRTVLMAAALFVLGVGLTVPLLRLYLSHGLKLPETSRQQTHLAVTGAMLVLAGSVLFVFTLLVHAAALATRYSIDSEGPGATTA